MPVFDSSEHMLLLHTTFDIALQTHYLLLHSAVVRYVITLCKEVSQVSLIGLKKAKWSLARQGGQAELLGRERKQ